MALEQLTEYCNVTREVKIKVRYSENRIFMDQVTQEVPRHSISIIGWPWNRSQNTTMSNYKSEY
jgi:hypothetical protein